MKDRNDQYIKDLEALAKEMASALEAVDSTVHFAKKLNNLSSDAVEAVDATLHFAKKVNEDATEINYAYKIDEDETDRILEEGDLMGTDELNSTSPDSFEVTGDEQPYVAV